MSQQNYRQNVGFLNFLGKATSSAAKLVSFNEILFRSLIGLLLHLSSGNVKYREKTERTSQKGARWCSLTMHHVINL